MKTFVQICLALTSMVALGLGLPSLAAAQGFDFDTPNLDKTPAKKSTPDIPLGSFGGLNLGVLFDVRYMASGDNAPGMVIHVNELNITGNIGNNISVLAEQLLPTSRLSGVEDQIGDDHGFVYAIFSNTSFLPPGTAFKIGRFRFKWGIDAVLDAPANPIYPLTRKNLGFITDKGVELSGFFGPLDYTLGVADGPENVEENVINSTGEFIGVVNRSVKNNSLPIVVRLSTKIGASKAGLSYFDGMSWAYANFTPNMPNVSFRAQHPGGMADRSKIIYRQHAAVDYSIKWEKFDFALEYSRGYDRDSRVNSVYGTAGYFARVDYDVKPQSMSIQLQYDQYDDGRPGVKDETGLSLGLQLYVYEQAFIRIGYMYNRLGLAQADDAGMYNNTGFAQFYLPL
jgi:hypothetical protein